MGLILILAGVAVLFVIYKIVDFLDDYIGGAVAAKLVVPVLVPIILVAIGIILLGVLGIF